MRSRPVIHLTDHIGFDNHCRITFQGQNWWIRRIVGHLMYLRNENGRIIADTSKADWEAYCIAAAEMIEAEYG